jgi:Tol biopolymer transport system component
MPHSETLQASPRERLDSWKAVAAYLQRDVRTVQRWEKTEHLPVRRLKHDARSTVFAWTDELDEWVASRSEAPAAPTARTRTRLVAVSAAVLMLAFVLWRVASAPRTKPQALLLPRPITAEEGFNWGPRFSPDGSRIAYTRKLSPAEPANVIIRGVSGGDEIVVNPTPLNEYSPAWSPSGAEVAFLRQVAAVMIDLVVVSLPDFEERRITQLHAPIFENGGTLGHDWLDWSPDGRYIVAPEQEVADAPFRVTLIEVQTGRRRFLTDPPERSQGDTNARFSPDGSRLAVVRRWDRAQDELLQIELNKDLRPGNLSKHVHLNPTGSPARLLGISWTPDGRRLVFSAEDGGGVTSRLWSEPAGGASSSTPFPGSSLSIQSFDIVESPDGRWPLAYVNASPDVDIVKVPLIQTAAGPVAAPENRWTKIAESLANDNRAAISPDGRSLAFTSDRTGSPQIWMVDLSSGELQQLTNFPSARLGHKVWSPDGREIAFIRFGPQGRDIDSVRVSDKRVTTLLDHPDHELGQFYSRDGRYLYYTRGRDNRSLPLRLPLSGGEPEEFLGRAAKAVQDDPRGGWIYVWQNQLWSLRDPRAEPVLLLENTGWDQTSSAITEKGVYMVTNRDSLLFHSFADAKSKTLVQFTIPARAGIAVSPDEDAVFVTLLEHQMQIMTLEDVGASR